MSVPGAVPLFTLPFHYNKAVSGKKTQLCQQKNLLSSSTSDILIFISEISKSKDPSLFCWKKRGFFKSVSFTAVTRKDSNLVNRAAPFRTRKRPATTAAFPPSVLFSPNCACLRNLVLQHALRLIRFAQKTLRVLRSGVRIHAAYKKKGSPDGTTLFWHAVRDSNP